MSKLENALNKIAQYGGIPSRFLKGLRKSDEPTTREMPLADPTPKPERKPPKEIETLPMKPAEIDPDLLAMEKEKDEEILKDEIGNEAYTSDELAELLSGYDIEKNIITASKKEKLKGGRADGKSDKSFPKKELEKGIKVEREHTTDKSVAKEIAKDHLTEGDKYYQYLEQMERKLKKNKRKK